MPIPDDIALSAHFKLIEATTQAEVCSAKVTGFQAKFGRLFVKWRVANAEALERGAALAEQKGWNKPNGQNLQSFARMEADILAQIPEDDRQRRCDELPASFLDVKKR
jgi:hypothetical protein